MEFNEVAAMDSRAARSMLFDVIGQSHTTAICSELTARSMLFDVIGQSREMYEDHAARQIKALLSRIDADLLNASSPEHNCFTLLTAASRFGTPVVLETILADTRVNPDQKDGQGDLPLLGVLFTTVCPIDNMPYAASQRKILALTRAGADIHAIGTNPFEKDEPHEISPIAFAEKYRSVGGFVTDLPGQMREAYEQARQNKTSIKKESNINAYT